MKRPLLLPLLLLLAGLSACAAEEAFYVAVTNGSPAEVYGIQFEYALAGETLGSGGVVCADGSAVRRGDVLTMDFTPEGFQGETDLSAFTCRVCVVLAGDRVQPAGEALRLDAAYGATYRFTLTGDPETGFRLTGEDA